MTQLTNPERQEKKCIMREKRMTGKQYRKWLNAEKRKEQNAKKAETEQTENYGK